MRTALAAIALLLSSACASQTPRLGASAQAIVEAGSEACGRCHPQELATWKRSRHAASFTNGTFAASFAGEHVVERRRWCLQCHAPPPEKSVGCAACHVREGSVLVASPPSAAARKAHPVSFEPALRSSEFCGGCHQFPVPVFRDGTVLAGAEPLQDTVEEWRRTSAAAAGRTCQSCHMPAGAHSFPGAHDEAFLHGAITVTGSVLDGRFELELTRDDVGHRFPTGDPFRALELRLCADETCSPPLSTRLFHRVFMNEGGTFRKVRDTTIEGSIKESLPLPDGARYWELRYRYGDPALTRVEPDPLFLVLSHGRI